MRKTILAAILLSAAFSASCGSAQPADNAAQNGSLPFKIAAVGSFDAPWAARFAPGTQVLFVTEKKGTMKFVDLPSGREGTVTGIPPVNFSGQGGFADVAFLPGERSATLGKRTIYLSWAEAGEGPRSGVVGKGTLVCAQADACRVEGLQVIWRQVPKTSGPLQFALRLTFSPDGKYLFVASGDRVAIDNVQTLGSNLGKIVRLLPDGRPAPGNPFASQGSLANEVWTYGHRNPLGLKFDLAGQLWDLEHGPRGGDEINRLAPGQNYGWPLVSGGDNYDGTPIPKNQSRPDLAQPAIMWNPVIAPGDFVFYSGKLWPQWKGQALIAGLGTQAIVRVSLAGDKGTEQARYKFDHRLREIVEAPDGSLYVLEDGAGGRLLHLTPG
ncbi:MAG: PQQ-dependent sugar dehydrogenase [Croceibacterium sp.]